MCFAVLRFLLKMFRTYALAPEINQCIKYIYRPWDFRFPHHAESVTFFCFKSMLQIEFRPIACAEGSKKDQYSIGSSIGSGRARPEIATPRNTHIPCRFLRFLGAGIARNPGNVENCTLFALKACSVCENAKTRNS